MKRFINTKKIATLGVLAGCVVCLNSCLKNNKYYIDFANVGTTVEMAMAHARAVTPPNAITYLTDLGLGAYVDTINYSSTSQSVPVYVNVASPNVSGTATTVTLTLDTAALSAFNTEFGQVNAGYWANNFDPVPGLAYELLPANAYHVTSWTVTVPAGQRLAPLNVVVSPSLIDTTTMTATDGGGNPVQIYKHNYVLPVSIKTASQKVSNWKTVMVNVQVMPQ